MSPLQNFLQAALQQAGLPDLDAPPPAPWGEGPEQREDQDPLPEESPQPVREPWAEDGQPIREPESGAQRWRLH